MQAILSASLSVFPDFSPSALAQSLQILIMQPIIVLAEGVRFELTVPVRVRTFSKRVP